jgi:beta-glucosidase
MRFGVATAAYQIEGAVGEDGRGESIWDRFCRVPGAVAGGDTGDVACDHYHRWRADLDLMAALGIESYRFSIAWPRIQPEGHGQPNRRGLDFYRRLVEGLLARDIEPIATMYHWDLPQALQDEGGWASRDTAARFADYAEIVADALGDVVAHWITHNEQWVSAFLGHAEGTKAPGVRDWPSALRASHHLLLSHGLAVRALRAHLGEGASVGIALNPVPVEAASVRVADLEATVRMDAYQNRWFLDPLLRGSYPADLWRWLEDRVGPWDAVREGDLAMISAPIDFLGVNYYRPARVVADADAGPLELRQAPFDGPSTAMGWEVSPDGLRRLLVRLREDYGDVPIFVTENGAAFVDGPADNGSVPDEPRVAYLERHLAALDEAVRAGVDVRRYCVWSLLDNFEWEHGYEPRFGIVHVDFDTQRRIPKHSGLWYRDHIARVRAERAGAPSAAPAEAPTAPSSTPAAAAPGGEA